MSICASKMRNWSVSLEPDHLASRRTTGRSRSASWSASFVRAGQPERARLHDLQPVVGEADRRRTRAPCRTPPGWRRRGRRGSGTGSPIAVKITRPPIVGVPAFRWCSAGPSSRMCWPNSRCAQELDELRARGRSRSAARRAPRSGSRPSRCPARRVDRLERLARRARGRPTREPLTSTTSPGSTSSRNERRRLRRRRRASCTSPAPP